MLEGKAVAAQEEEEEEDDGARAAVGTGGRDATVTTAKLAALLEATAAEPFAETSAASAMAALAFVLQDPRMLTAIDEAKRSNLADSLFQRPSLA